AGKLYLYDFYVASDEPYIQRRVLDDVTASALYHTNIGSVALKEGDVQGALTNLELATRLAPDVAAVWVNLGVARRRLGNLEGAAQAYEKALKAEPGDPSALTNLAYLYRLEGHEAEAKAALQAASRGPSSPYTLIALAGVEEVQGHLKDARRHLLRARRGYRHVPEVWDALARFASRRGDADRAARYRKKAERLREKAAASNS
ncbi:MAG: tetratricopeptide repeat protein, partial [Acidobacteria bacterium]|nr:tetratricopeptide repeat protein [Acidobacteriota bacterium]